MRAWRGPLAVRVVPLVALLGVSACGATGLESQAADPSVRLSAVFLNAGAAEAALRAADEALARQPRSAAAHEARGDALAALGMLDEAQQAYAAAIGLAPSAIAPRIALGRLLVRLNPPEAERVFGEVLAREPRNAVALNNLGIARDLQGQHEAAQAAYRAALAADPAMSGAGVNLGLSLVLSGKMAEAIRTLGPLAAAPGASGTVIENLAIALVANGQPAEAERLLGRPISTEEAMATLRGFRQGVEPATAAIVAPQPLGASQPLGVSQPSGVFQPPAPPQAFTPPPAAPPERMRGPTPLQPPSLRPAPNPSQPISALPPPPMAAVPESRPVSLRVAAAALPLVTGPAAAVPPVGPYAAAEPLPVRTLPAVALNDALASAGSAAPVEQPGVVVVPVAAIVAAPTVRAEAPPAPVAPVQPLLQTPVKTSTSGPIGTRLAFAQLAAIDAGAMAELEWLRLRRQLGPLLSNRQEITIAAEVAGRSVLRLRTGPFHEPREAEAFCAEVRAAGRGCWAAVTGS